MKESDIDLLLEYQSTGNQEILGRLYNRYMTQVYGASLSYLKDVQLAQDAVMDIYEELVEKCKKHQVEHWPAWLYMVTRNHCLQKLRKEKLTLVKKNDAELMYTEQILHHTSTDEALEGQLKSLEACIDQLNAAQKTCVKAFYLEKNSYKQIAATTNFSWQQVRSHLQNGRRNLSRCLKTQ